MIRRIWIFGLLIAAAFFFGYSFRLHREATPSPPEPRGDKEIHVEVRNGCGTDGVARQVGRYLRLIGFDVMTVDNAESFNYPETLVIDRVGNTEYARRVAEALGTQNQIQQIIPDPFRIEQVTVIVGRDYKRLALPQSQ